MQASNNVKYYHYLVFAIWLVFIVLVGSNFIKSRLTPFDPEEKLINIDGIDLIREIRSIPELEKVSFEKTLIHFTSEGCGCTQFSENHKSEITRKAINDGFKVVNIHLPVKVKTIIPSTPSILIVSSTSELLYYGPYSTGLACSESNGFVELVLNNYTSGFNSNLIINDTTGCYCKI
ncbi:DUF6436 domain-containing protein [Pseudoalteromonas sp. NGC95]|uniref:DUF6436 domain-containing protein n=1 Tax=Pseudoalteromonas sp. NGC95 TaxID=2792051 RepID=UPI0018CD057B|nr:DUF6436 domain-containing protein [Pseudoalteromonas sp. NGC95]MBH0017918.1 hypothetical protein [Pseudoalteromonas sp. NGC95]